MLTTPFALDNIYLVGPMGVGKSTIGRKLAERFDLTFKDSDHEIEERTGASIPLIFDIEGEDGFRKREQMVIDDLTQMSQLILATGGGVIINPENRRALKERGLVVYLHASVDTLLERTAFCRNRPLLQTENPRARLEELMQIRHSLYQEVADITIETGDKTILQVVKAIVKRIKRLQKS
ncbi:shikimate kinase AroK [Candidatus Albibeggiatoa sp. nov. BB20]|uniref:shikimate kinase AroK n=1 Tax=Candidatus Albibeggiatoa sp. nov. BB20 TaxID=3162723 RepID=UPI0033659F01